MTRILVTGANGQLGQSIQRIASNYPALEFFFKNSKDMDITDTQNVAEIFENGHYHYCINCAAYTNVEQAESEQKKAFAVNAEGVRNIAENCFKNDVTLIHISTDYVFDGEKKEPYTINDKPNPINVYGASKLKGEQYIREIPGRYFIIRTSWLYSEFGNNFYKTILKKTKTDKVLRVTDKQKGCPTHAKNLANFVLGLIDSRSTHYGLHHFTDGEAMTWYGFAKRILAENGLENSLRLKKAKNYRTFARRPKNSVLATSYN
ncbi:dTDP-4-dehydrorhamnose reductase [Pricia sp.]|uniref:dTDP-4-dehydrorhamnose reductase n=1 Tax=Pricia sp. TaxID=2268138 RepID=UPI0035942533